jgi:hypothetical protein
MTWLIDLKTLLVGSLSSCGSIAAAASTRWAQITMRRSAKREVAEKRANRVAAAYAAVSSSRGSVN